MLITIPFDLIPMLVENLEDMEWNPFWFKVGREGFIESTRILVEELWAEYPTEQG